MWSPNQTICRYEIPNQGNPEPDYSKRCYLIAFLACLSKHSVEREETMRYSYCETALGGRKSCRQAVGSQSSPMCITSVMGCSCHSSQEQHTSVHAQQSSEHSALEFPALHFLVCGSTDELWVSQRSLPLPTYCCRSVLTVRVWVNYWYGRDSIQLSNVFVIFSQKQNKVFDAQTLQLFSAAAGPCVPRAQCIGTALVMLTCSTKVCIRGFK